MQKWILISVFAAILVSSVLSDEVEDLKVEKEKFTEAKAAVKTILAKMKSDYIQNFVQILDQGVDDLEKRTQEELKTEKDATKREAIINFATKSYERLVKFFRDIEENLPNQ